MKAALALVLFACQQSTPPPPAPASARAVVSTLIWDHADGAEPFAVVGDALLAYDSKREGIADISTATGKELRFRKIAHTPVYGTPGMWVPVDGGYLVSWDERIVYIREQAGALSFGWMVGESSWYTGIGGGDVAWLGKGRDEAGLYAIDVKDGHTRWTAKLPAGIQGFEMGGDATTIVTSHQEYQHTPPGEHDIHRVFGAYASATGKLRWRAELPDEPRDAAVGVGGAIAVTDEEILLFDAMTGKRRAVRLAARTTTHTLVDDGVAFIEDENAYSLDAYALSDGHLIWSVQLPFAPSVGMTALSARLAARGDFVYVAAHGEVHALARATGTLAWSVQTGADPYRLAVTSSGVVEIDSHRATGFALPATAPVLETATIHGIVRDVKCGTRPTVWVRAGNVRVHPDETGAFRATIRATGRIVVGVPFNRRLEPNEEPITSGVTIQLTGKGDYAVPDLVADDCGYTYE